MMLVRAVDFSSRAEGGESDKMLVKFPALSRIMN